MEIPTELTEEQQNFKKDDKLICKISYDRGASSAEDDLDLEENETVKFEQYLKGDKNFSMVYKEGATEPGVYPTAGLKKIIKKGAGSATSETIYPIVVEIPMEGGSLSWDEGVEEKKIENATEQRDTLLGQWDEYVETFISKIKKENNSSFQNGKNYKFIYLREIDQLGLMDTENQINISEIWNQTNDYDTIINHSFIVDNLKESFVLNLAFWKKTKLTMDLLFNSVYEYKTIAEAWGELRFTNIPTDNNDPHYIEQPYARQINQYYDDLFAYKNNNDSSNEEKKIISLLSKGKDSITNVDWKDLILLANCHTFNYKNIQRSIISLVSVLNLLILRFFIKLYMEQMKTNDSFSDTIIDAEKKITNHLDDEMDAILSPPDDDASRGGGASPIIAGYFKHIYEHIIPKYFSGVKVKPVVHRCLMKLASFVLLFDTYDQEGEILNILCIPAFAPRLQELYVKFRIPKLIDEDKGPKLIFDNKILKYYLFWLKHALDDTSVNDALSNYTNYENTSKSDPPIPGGPNYYTRVRLLTNLLLGNEINPSEITSMRKFPDDAPKPLLDKLTTVQQIALLTEFDSSFIRSTSPPSTDKLYTMYDYIVEGDQFKIRSFTAKLKIDGGKITSFENSGDFAVVAEGTMKSIETLFEALKDKQPGKLMKLKFEDGIASSMRDDKYNKEKSYILGYTDNEEYEDKLRETLIHKAVGGFKQRGGEKEKVEQSIKKWRTDLSAKIQAMKLSPQEESILSNPSKNTLESNISKLENAIKKMDSVAPQIKNILEKGDILIINANGGTKKRKRRRKRRRNVLKTTMKK